MSDDNTPMQHPFDTRGVLLLVGWLLITLSIILLVAMVYNWTGFVHFALVVTFYGPFFLGAIFGLVAIKLFLLPILERLWGFVERIRLFRYRQWKQGVIIDGNKTVINEELVPYARVDTTKELTIQQRIETNERPNHLLLPAPVAQPPLLAKDLLPQLLALAETNWTQPWHDEKRWLLGQNTETRELVESLFMIELINIMIGGQPKRGKTNALRWLIMNMIASGGKFLLYDPHAEHLRRGLLAQLLPLRDFFYMPPVSAANETGVYTQFCQLRDIYVERELHNIEHPLLLTIADEYAELLSKLTNRARRREVETIIANVIKGGNKFGMLMLFANHNWQVSGIGGSETRDNITGALCFSTAKSQYSMVLGTDEHEHLTSRPIAVGEAITKRMGYPLETIRLPLVEEDDLVTFAKEIKRLGTPATPETTRTHTSIFTAFTVADEETTDWNTPKNQEGNRSKYIYSTARQGAPCPQDTRQGEHTHAPDQQGEPRHNTYLRSTHAHSPTKSTPVLEPLQPKSHETYQNSRQGEHISRDTATGTEHHATSIEKSDPPRSTPDATEIQQPHNPRTTRPHSMPQRHNEVPATTSRATYQGAQETINYQPLQQKEQKKEREKGTGKVPEKVPVLKGPIPREKRARITERAKEMMDELKCVPRKRLQKRAGIHNDEYWMIPYICYELGFPEVVPPDFSDEEWEDIKEYYRWTCIAPMCRKRVPEIQLEPDHVNPPALGGTNTKDNIQPLCGPCNDKKGQRHIDYRPQWEEEHRSEQKV